jgi:hypothetical protein
VNFISGYIAGNGSCAFILLEGRTIIKLQEVGSMCHHISGRRGHVSYFREQEMLYYIS